jgi:hypothetical protein
MPESTGGDRIYLKEYVERLLAGHERELVLRMAAMEKALDLARLEVDRRLGELNKLRAEVTADREQFVIKALYEVRWSDMNDWRESIADRITKIETRGITWLAAIGVFSALVSFAVSLYFRRG